MQKKIKLPQNYENNPFFVASSGITWLFDLARGTGIFLLGISLVQFLYSMWPSGNSGTPSYDGFRHSISAYDPFDWVLVIGTIGIIGVALAMIGALISGISAYTAAQLAVGKQVQLGEAFRVSFDHLWSFLWLKILIFIKVVLWSLLFIIPGIIMGIRYSLAEVAFFDEDKNMRGNAAIKESLRLTRGAWLTTFASYVLFNALTLGAIQYVVSTSVNAKLYSQFDKLQAKKPDAHWLSWATLIAPIAIIILIILAVIGLAVGISLSGQPNQTF